MKEFKTMSLSNLVLTTDYTAHLNSSLADSCQRFTFKNTQAVPLTPDGHIEFIFQLNNSFAHKTDGLDWVDRPQFFVGGLHSKAFEVKARDSSTELISVRLKVHEARHLLPLPLNEFKNRIVDLNEIFSKEALSLLMPLQENLDSVQQLGQIAAFLMQIYRPGTASPVDFVLRQIQARKGNIKLVEMSESVNMSIPALRNRFVREVGMTPKEYARIVRFTWVSDHMVHHSQDSLTEIAYALGYYDQAHFIKDFKDITGVSPKVFRKELIP